MYVCAITHIQRHQEVSRSLNFEHNLTWGYILFLCEGMCICLLYTQKIFFFHENFCSSVSSPGLCRFLSVREISVTVFNGHRSSFCFGVNGSPNEGDHSLLSGHGVKGGYKNTYSAFIYLRCLIRT
jgi:hypothetical protein